MVICLLAGLCVFSNIFIVSIQQNIKQDLERATQERFRAHQLAGEFKRTIDDLHNMLQNYVTFRDEIYGDKYDDIKLIVDGDKSRPTNYNELYRNSPPDYGFEQLNIDPDKSLYYAINNSGIADQELAPLLIAINDYQDLISVQEKIKTLVPENAQEAADLLRSETYQDTKIKVMRPIIEFINFQESKHQQIITGIVEQQKYYQDWQNTLLVLIGMFIFIVLLLTKKHIVNPVTTLSDAMQETIPENDGDQPRTLEDLVGKTQNVIEELKSKTSEQYKTEQKLISVLKQLELNPNIDVSVPEDSNFGNWTVDLRTGAINWSQAAINIYGFSDDENLKPSRELFLSIVHPDDKERVDASITDTLEHNKHYHSEHRIITASGEVRYVSSRGDILHSEDGSPSFLYGTVLDVTEKKLVEQKAGKIEKLLLDAQRIAQVGNWEVDFINHERFWSDEVFRISGLVPGALKPSVESLRKMVHPDDFDRVIQAIENAKDKNINYDVHFRIVRPTGEIRYIYSYGEVTYDKDNTALSMHGIFHDITERKLAEKTSQEREEKLLEIQSIANLGFWTMDIANQTISLSDEIYIIYDLDPSSFSPTIEKFDSHIHPDDINIIKTASDKAKEGGGLFEVEHRVIRATGEIRFVQVRAKISFDNHKTPVAIDATMLDITERKRAEEAAKETEEHLSEIFNIAPAAIISTDHLMNITIFNKAAIEIFGYSNEEIIGKHIKILIPEEYRKGHDHKIDQFNNSGSHTRNMNERTGIYGVKKNGDIFPAAASVSSIGKGRERLYTIILLDTTERKIIEEERAIALTQAQEANRAKSQFLATMSHELRTPLNAIIGFSEMMTNKIFGEMGSDKYTEYADDIVGSSRHLLNLVDDILDLSEIESGRKSMNIIQLSLRDTVEECQYIIHKIADDKNISCTYDIPDDLTMIYADQRSLKQVIINIMTNSVKFTGHGGKIALKAEFNNQNHLITITDTGEGIPEDRLNDILNPFTRVENDPYKTQEGKGLGLAIVKSLMTLHDGEIIIESTFGEGTKITLVFPNKQ